MTAVKPTRAAFRFTGDHALGIAGLGLAAASAAFGIGMTMHGPAASLGTGHDFTVFAQLAPHRGDRQGIAGRGKAGEGKGEADDLDMTATASIPKAEAVISQAATPGSATPEAATSQAVDPNAGDAAIIPAVTLEAVGTDSATVAIEGRTRVVRIGDDVPGAGQVLAILPGTRPALKTSRGLIVPAAE